jgi:hypothetical protein
MSTFEVLNRWGLPVCRGTKERVKDFLLENDDWDGLTVVPDHQYDKEMTRAEFMEEVG